MIERRKYPRFELKVDASYKILSSEGVYRRGNTHNISAEGICFESDKRLAAGAHVGLEVDLGDKEKPIALVGEIKWSQELKAKGQEEMKFVNGVKLIDIPKSDEGRFLRYYCDRMVEKLSSYLAV